MDEFGFVGSRHDDEVREAAEVGHVECPGVGRPVCADEPGPVDRKPDWQFLEGHVVYDLVVAALQERRIDRRERLIALGRETCRERHGVLFGNADIECPIGKARPERVEPGSAGHGGRHRDDFGVVLGLRNEALGEYLGIGRGRRLRFHLDASRHVERVDAVIAVRRSFGWGIALALARLDVDEDGSLLAIPYVLQDRQQLVEIVPVDRANVVKSEFLEPGSALPERAGVFLDPGRAAFPLLRKPFGKLFGGVPEVEIRAARCNAGQV